MEEHIQDVFNEAGQLATGKTLKQFDTDGSPIICGMCKAFPPRTQQQLKSVKASSENMLGLLYHD